MQENEEKPVVPADTQEKSETPKESPSVTVDTAEAEFAECNTEKQNTVKGNGIHWDEREFLFFGAYYKKQDQNGFEKERFMSSTGDLATLAIDRSCRVMAQLPSGRFENLSGDTGKNVLMNILFQHYVIPNANTGGPVMQKLRMADLYSDLYSIPLLVEYRSSTDEKAYQGPDFSVIDPRRFYPQPGKSSVPDMDYCYVDTFVSKKWLEEKKGKASFKNIDKILETAADSGPNGQEVQATQRGNKQVGFRIRHRFSKCGDWFAYSPDAKVEMVDEKKWFPRIPVVMKHQFPVIGSLWSFTNFERGFETQRKIDVLGDANLRATEMMIDPPYIMDPEDVVLSSFKREARAKWFVKDGKVDRVKPATIAPQALGAYTSSHQILKANLLSMSASNDTSVASQVDPGFGKTPEAVKQQSMVRGARDSWDQYMMQQCIEDLFSLMADMIAHRGVGKYGFSLVSSAVENLKEEYPGEDIDAFINGNRFEVDKEQIVGKYRYVMDPMSTLVKQEDTADAILALLKIYGENEQIAKDLLENGERLALGAAFKMILKEKGSKFADRLIVKAAPPVAPETVTLPATTTDPAALSEMNQPTATEPAMQ